jgi:cyclopropane fatty-acyl-phospholipid synthase-like methyltransferase
VPPLQADLPEYFAAEDLDARIEGSRPLLRSLATMAGGNRILGVGSGRGEVLAAGALEGLEVHGSDISPVMADECQRLYGVGPLVGDLEDYEEDPFDASAPLMFLA